MWQAFSDLDHLDHFLFLKLSRQGNGWRRVHPCVVSRHANIHPHAQPPDREIARANGANRNI
jgi:hypothetical protein